MTFSLRRNSDQALPASHTIKVMFNLPADFPFGGVSNVPGILMKQAEQEGQAWNGVQVASWMSQALGRDVHPTRGWEVLRRWGFKQKVPRESE